MGLPQTYSIGCHMVALTPTHYSVLPPAERLATALQDYRYLYPLLPFLRCKLIFYNVETPLYTQIDFESLFFSPEINILNQLL